MAVDFELFDANGLPPGWVPSETEGRGTPAGWGQVLGFGKGAGFGVLESKNARVTASLAQLEGFATRDFTAELRIRVHQGEHSRSAGLAFAFVDADHYDVVVCDPLARRLELRRCTAGAFRLLAGVDLPEVGDAWQLLRVERVETALRARLGDTLLEHDYGDEARKGGLALWAEGDAQAWFDALRVW